MPQETIPFSHRSENHTGSFELVSTESLPPAAQTLLNQFASKYYQLITHTPRHNDNTDTFFSNGCRLGYCIRENNLIGHQTINHTINTPNGFHSGILFTMNRNRASAGLISFSYPYSNILHCLYQSQGELLTATHLLLTTQANSAKPIHTQKIQSLYSPPNSKLWIEPNRNNGQHFSDCIRVFLFTLSPEKISQTLNSLTPEPYYLDTFNTLIQLNDE